MQTYLSDILHVVAQALLIPDIILLLLFIGYALFSIGSVVSEHFTEHRHFRVTMPKFLAALMKADEDDIPDVIMESGLLKRQKKALLTVFDYRTLPGDALIALIKREVGEEEARYDRISGRNNMAARVAPMLGLMGTLIPLGPGIQALGKADTATLSSSLLIAFDTTVAGLVVAAVCLVIGKIRSGWYNDYMSALDSAMATMLEKIEQMRAEGKIATQEPSDYAFLYESGAIVAQPEKAQPKKRAEENEARVPRREPERQGSEKEFAGQSMPLVTPVPDTAPDAGKQVSERSEEQSQVGERSEVEQPRSETPVFDRLMAERAAAMEQAKVQPAVAQPVSVQRDASEQATSNQPLAAVETSAEEEKPAADVQDKKESAVAALEELLEKATPAPVEAVPTQAQATAETVASQTDEVVEAVEPPASQPLAYTEVSRPVPIATEQQPVATQDVGVQQQTATEAERGASRSSWYRPQISNFSAATAAAQNAQSMKSVPIDVKSQDDSDSTDDPDDLYSLDFTLE